MAGQGVAAQMELALVRAGTPVKPLTYTTTTTSKQKRDLKKRREDMIKFYVRQNCHDLTFTFIDSHRPDGGINEEELTGRGGMNIHSFRPSYHSVGNDGITVRSLTTSSVFDIRALTIPKPKRTTKRTMKKYWRPLAANTSFQANVNYQAKKHLKFHKLHQLGKDIYDEGIRWGKEYVSRKGKFYLMNIIKRKGYVPGNVYLCRDFVKDIVDGLRCGVKITFEDHPNGVASKIKYLHEVSILCDKKAKRLITGSRKQSFDKKSVFLFEDLRVRCIISATNSRT